jgi:thioredoxin 2
MTGTAHETNAAAAHRITVRCQFCETWNRVVAERAADRPKCGKCGRPMLIDRPIALTDDTFARTITESEIPVVVDFYADWCGPCKVMAPAVDQLAAENQGKLLVAKLDTDRSPRTAQSFNIRGIPTVVVFEHGKEARRASGAMPLKALQQLVQQAQ